MDLTKRGRRCLRRLSSTLCLLLVTAILTLPSPTARAEKTEHPKLEPIQLQLRWMHQFQFAGYYAAKHLGYYRDIGLDVDIQAGAPGVEPVNEVLNGRAHYGVANGELLHQRLQGAPLVALAAIFQHSASVFMVRRDSGIRTPQDLIGKDVMMISTGADVGLVAMLHNEGVDIDRVNIIKSSYDVNDLVAGKVDAFNAYLTNEPFYMLQQGVLTSLIYPSTYGVDFYSDILFTSEQELLQHPERVKQFREASLKGWQYAMENPEEIIDLIINQYTDRKSREHLRFEANSMRQLIMPDLIEYGHMNPGRWDHMAETFVIHGMAEPGFDLEGFIYDPNPVQDMSRWYLLILGLLAAVLATFAIIAALVNYNRKLQNAIDFGLATQTKLQQQTAFFEAIFNSSPDATLICDNQQTVRFCNPALFSSFGYTAEQLIGQSAQRLFNNVDDFLAQQQRYLEQGNKPCDEPYEIDYRRQDGTVFPSQSISGPIIDAEGRHLGCILVIRDITEQKRSQQEVIKMALTDPLTGLANRHQFNRKLEQLTDLADRQQKLLSLAIMDLDLFKQVNDRYGHPVGDELLINVAKRVQDTFRKTDIVARIGGDEFAILMIDPENEGAIRQPAERIIEALSEPLLIDGQPVEIGVSFGVATYPLDSDSPATLYRLADRALYHSKALGRNRCSLAHELSTTQLKPNNQLVANPE